MRKLHTDDAWLNGLALSDVDAAIIVRPAIEPEQKSNIQYISNAGRSGRYIASDTRDSKIVQVRFSIKGLANLTERSRVIDAVNGWAATGGLLQLSSRVDQQIGVTCIKYVTPIDIISPAGVYVLEFEANSVPYWQDIDNQSIIIESDDDNSNIIVRGTTESVIKFVAHATSGTLTTLTVTATSANGHVSSITLSGLNLASGTDIVFDHDVLGFLTISAGGVSLLNKRTAASDDDLFVWPGTANVAVSANTTVHVQFYVWGRWV